MNNSTGIWKLETGNMKQVKRPGGVNGLRIVIVMVAAPSTSLYIHVRSSYTYGWLAVSSVHNTPNMS